MSPTREDLIAILRDVRDGRRDRAEVVAWAKGQPGDLPCTLEALTLPRSGHSKSAPGQEGDWFLDTPELDDWLLVLEGRSETRPLESGWARFLNEPWPDTKAVLLGQFHERPQGQLLRELGRPQRGRDDFAPWESWELRGPSGIHLRLARHIHYDPAFPANWYELIASVPGATDPQQAADAALPELSDLLDITAESVMYLNQVTLPPARWEVWRRDDWGNELRVSRHLSRVAAERVERRFSERGHKQDYWAQPA